MANAVTLSSPYNVPLPTLTHSLQTAVCVCRMLKDPYVAPFKGDDFEQVKQNEEQILSEKTGVCAYKVEALVGSFGNGPSVEQWLEVTLRNGTVIVKLNKNKQVEVSKI